MALDVFFSFSNAVWMDKGAIVLPGRCGKVKYKVGIH